jgi:hypothetical protein
MAQLIAFLVIFALAIFLSFLFSWPVWLLWNGCLVDAVAGVSEITWLQAWGITVLFNLLFKTTSTKTSN